MADFYPMHFLIVLLIPLFVIVVIPLLAYRHGKKVEDAAGYIRGYKEGQQSSNK